MKRGLKAGQNSEEFTRSQTNGNLARKVFKTSDKYWKSSYQRKTSEKKDKGGGYGLEIPCEYQFYGRCLLNKLAERKPEEREI